MYGVSIDSGILSGGGDSVTLIANSGAFLLNGTQAVTMSTTGVVISNYVSTTSVTDGVIISGTKVTDIDFGESFTFQSGTAKAITLTLNSDGLVADASALKIGLNTISVYSTDTVSGSTGISVDFSTLAGSATSVYKYLVSDTTTFGGKSDTTPDLDLTDPAAFNKLSNGKANNQTI